MSYPNITGFCKWSAAESAERLFLFTHDGKCYAVLKDHVCLILTDRLYAAHVAVCGT